MDARTIEPRADTPDRLRRRAEQLDIWAQQARVYGLEGLASIYRQTANDTRQWARAIDEDINAGRPPGARYTNAPATR
jgi:hypothetical protein